MPVETFASVEEIEAAGDKLYSYCPQSGVSTWPGLRFTAWKYDGYSQTTIDPPKMDGGFVAQWLYSEGKETAKGYGRNFYVNLPGMQSGEYVAGSWFDIGTERVYADTSKEEIIRLVTEGKAKLITLLEKEGIQVANQ
jgi:hypothetical protein